MSNSNFVELKVIAIIFVGATFANLEIRLTTTKMVSIPFGELGHEIHGNNFPRFTWDWWKPI
jgi:hypothetical protein